jgi:hypothetical protein
MHVHILLLLLMTCSVVIAAEPTWPSKGDTVYIAASLKNVRSETLVFGASPMESDIPACAPLVIKKAKPKKLLWITKDPVGGSQRLEGPWLERMHKAEAACMKQHTSEGEPRIARSGWVHKIIPKQPDTKATEDSKTP